MIKIKQRKVRKLSWVLLALTLAGCATHSPEQRRQAAEMMADAAGWQSITLSGDSFMLLAFVPKETHNSDLLTIYIEGDGLAWVTPFRPSQDPTPIHPIALQLALRHSPGAAAYLARPCQYVTGEDWRNCQTAWWTDRRFATEVVQATGRAVDQLKHRFHASNIVLIGYSGGGAIATLLAAQRKDVVRLVTVAGNLDHVRWTQLHHVAPLTGSLNPADAWQALLDVPQVHFVGGNDSNVSQEIAASYVARFPADKRPELRIIEGLDHACCWVEQWPQLYR